MLLSVKNFQSIKSQSLELNGFVVIEGQTDCGKSALRRALDSLLFNNWRESYLREGTTLCELTLEDGESSITQLKGGKTNQYEVTIEGITDKFDKVGKTTPDLVQDLGYRYFETSNGAHNLTITTQLESLFMVTYANVENTRILNQVFDVDVFDLATTLTVSDINTQNRELNLCKADLEGHKIAQTVEAKKLADLDSRIGYLTKLVEKFNLLNSYIEADARNTKLEKMLKKNRKYLDYIDYYMHCLELANNYITLDAELAEVNSKYDIVTNKLRLVDISSEWNSGSKLIQSSTRVEKELRLNKVETTKNTDMLTLLGSLKVYELSDNYAKVINKLDDTEQRLNDSYGWERILEIKALYVLFESFNTSNENLDELLCGISDIEESLAKITKELSEFDLCPMCGQTTENGVCL